MMTKLWLGRYYLIRGKPKQAAGSFRSAISAAPGRPEGWLLLGSLQFRQNEVSEALRSLRHADELDLFDRSAEERLASFYLQNNDLLSALKWYRAALDLSSDHTRLRLAVATVELRLGLPEQAEEHLKSIPEYNDDVTALTLLAQSREDQEQLQEAGSVYIRILKLDQQNVVANNNLAMILIRLDEKPIEALRHANAAVQAAPNNPAALSTYATALVLADQPDKAESILPTVISQFPSDPWLRYAYGIVLSDQNKFEQARHHLEGCLLLDNDFRRKEQVLKLLRRSSSVNTEGDR